MTNTHGGQIIGSRRLPKAGGNFVTKFPHQRSHRRIHSVSAEWGLFLPFLSTWSIAMRNV